MAEKTYVIEDSAILAAFPSGKGGGVRTSMGRFAFSPGPFEGHDITGYNVRENVQVIDHVGPEHAEVVVGNVLFIYGQQETTGERIIRFVSSLLPKEQAPPVLDVRPDVPLY